jgi:hypothetical protein
VAALAPAPAAPAAGTSPVTINQFFGKARLAGSAAPAAPWHPFGLFHHKKARPEVRTVSYDLPDVVATASATGPSTPQLPIRQTEAPGPNQPNAGNTTSDSIGVVNPNTGGR